VPQVGMDGGVMTGRNDVTYQRRPPRRGDVALNISRESDGLLAMVSRLETKFLFFLGI
jgi:hypothetical protein